MKIILRADVAKLGRKGDVLEVANGYGRNYLVPKGLALKATDGAIAQAASMRRARDLKEAKDREGAQEVARRLTPVVIKISARAGPEGRLFGSVTTADLADAVATQAGITLDRRKIHLDEPIKSVGTHEVAVRLHTDVEARLSVEVVASSQ